MNKFTSLLLASIASVSALAQTATFTTSTEGNYWKVQKNPKFSTTATASAQVEITDKKAQVLDGLGATFNELGWDALCYLDSKAYAEVMNNLFSANGANFTYCRMPIGASDFGMNFYSLNDVADDFEMINFSIARDRHILLKYIKEAQKINPAIKIWASPWSPPAWMKTNNHYASSFDTETPNHNGLPKERELELPTTGFKMQYGYLKAYALYFTKFVRAYAAEGVKIEAVAVQNEPCSNHKFPSCTWRPEDMAYFVGNFLGPKFEQEGITTDIIFGTINRDNPDFTRVALNDNKAKKYFKGAGFQWDGKGAIPYISKEYPHLKMMHTEAECGNGSNDWGAAEHTWWQMKHYLKNGATVFSYWNMVLDQTGVSPWGWKQNSLITINTDTKVVEYHPEYYLMKHLCHDVEVGATRLVTEGDEDALAFQNPDGSVALVMVNRGNESKDVAVKYNGKFLNLKLQAKSFSTVTIK